MIFVKIIQNPPLRLLLGNIAVERMLAANERNKNEFLSYEKLSRSADYDLANS